MILIKDDQSRLEKFKEQVQKTLREYHTILSSQPKAEILEELLVKSLHRAGMETDWEPDFNHKVGKDLRLLSTGERISIKTGKITVRKKRPDRDLTISGSRLTSHDTLKEKIKFISNKKEDSYMLLTPSPESTLGNRCYELVSFSTDVLNYDEATWLPKLGRDNFTQTGFLADTKAYSASITSKMSDQLWTQIKDYENNPDIFYCKISV
jgi:hypothetical protein